LEGHLIGIELEGGFCLQEAVGSAAVHEVGANEPGEGQRARDGFLGRLSEAEQQEGSERAGDLDAHGILGGSEEAGDLEHLLDPAEEQLDGLAAFVEVGNLLGGSIEVVAEDAQHLAGLGLDPDLAHSVAKGFAPVLSLAGGQEADAVGEDRVPLGNGSSLSRVRGVLDLKRVTMRQPMLSSPAHQP
jgi:hypothetical protein